MKYDFNRWSEFYQRITTIFNGIIALSLLPFAWIYLEIEKSTKDPLLSGSSLIVIEVLSFLLIGLVMYLGYSRFKNEISTIRRDDQLRHKINSYFRIAVKRYLIYELAAVICMIITYISVQIWFAVLYIFILFIFSLARPKYDLVVKHLNLTKSEQEILAKDESL